MDSLIYSLSKISLLRALVKYYYDHLDRQSSMWGILVCWGRFSIPLGSKYAILQQKITLDTSYGKSQTFHCSKVYTLRLSTARVECNFLLQIGILRAKGYNKNVPNVQVCNPTPAPPRTLMSI